MPVDPANSAGLLMGLQLSISSRNFDMNTDPLTTISPGNLDQSFGPDGTGIVPLTIAQASGDTIIYGVADAPDNAVYATGQSTRDFIIARLTDEGTPDPGFGSNGFVVGGFPAETRAVGRSILTLDDGRFLLIALTGLAPDQPSLARFFADGTIDTTFGTNGYIVHRNRPVETESGDRPSSPDETADFQDMESSTLQADGKILVVQTYFMRLGERRTLMFRFNSDGSLDETFNQTGYVQVTLPGVTSANIRMYGCRVDEGGKPMACGAVIDESSAKIPLFVRYNVDGNLDTSFGGKGFVVIQVPMSKSAYLLRLIHQRNGRVLGIGASSSDEGLLISIEPDGQPNIQFNEGKPLLTQVDNLPTSWRDAKMQPDGKLVVVGSAKSAKGSGAVVARLIDARFDLDFAGKGWAFAKPDATTISTSCIALRKDGKITIGGYIRTEGLAGYKACVLRYHGSTQG